MGLGENIVAIRSIFPVTNVLDITYTLLIILRYIQDLDYSSPLTSYSKLIVWFILMSGMKRQKFSLPPTRTVIWSRISGDNQVDF